MTGPVVLVTGCSSGIGRATALALRDAGCTVVATARDPATLRDLDVADRIRLDVTDPDLDAVVADVVERHGRIDAVVNNAGYGAMMPLEEMPDEAMRAMFDVNLFGLHRLTRAVLPYLRAQGSGRIVNVSSIVGHLSFPMTGAYSASKHAVRAYTVALDAEVRPFGVRAVLVEPGRIDTGFAARSEQERRQWTDNGATGPYASAHRVWDRLRGEERGADAKVIARRIVRAVRARRPRTHYRAPLDAKAGALASKWLPEAWIVAVVSWYFNRRR